MAAEHPASAPTGKAEVNLRATMPMDEKKMQSLRALRSQFSRALQDFASSTSSFRILRSIPEIQPPSSSPVSTLFVLDSSFNPPSKAHSSLARSAFLSAQQSRDESSATISRHAAPRILFLLATVNADKKPKPADFEDRLVMMTLMAEDLQAQLIKRTTSSPPLHSDNDGAFSAPVIDIGITKEPYFTDKATSIAESRVYLPPSRNPDDVVEQVHITGFDTLTRIFTPKYYPKHDPPLSALEPFLSRHRIHATVRVESSSANDTDLEPEFGTIDKQKGYLEGLSNGALEDEGLKRQWADQVQLVVDESGDPEGVSSTGARESVKNGDYGQLGRYVGDGVREWILERGLYKD